MERRIDYRKLNIIAVIAMVVVFGLVLFIQSGVTDRVPEVTAVPDNCYDETLTVFTDADYSPYSFYGADGSFSGHDVELIIMIANELKMNLDLRLMNWYEAIDAMDAGEADVLMTCDYSDTFAGVDTLTKCEPVSFDDFLVYSKKKIGSSDELYGKRIAIMKNGNVSAQIDMMNLGRYCIEYEDNRKAMQALLNGEADCAVMRQTVGTVLLNELGAKGIEGRLGIGQSFMCFGVRDAATADRINSAIETLKMNGELSRLHEKWLTTFIRPYTVREVLENNYWLDVLFILLAAAAVSAMLVGNARRRRTEAEQHSKDMEQQRLLKEALDAADAANASKTNFLFNMSHDIRTPMNAISGFTNMALKYIDDREKVRECLVKTQKAGSMLLSLINSILDVSRIESGNARLDERPAMITHSFDNIDVVLNEMAAAKNIELTFDMGEVTDDYILCDIDRFNRIFTNIISNAIKYTKEGGRVKVCCEQIGEAENGYGTYRYTVEDNGIGMSEEFQKHVFDRFSREENSTISGVQGSGLGMSVVKSFVDLMNGTVGCESRQGVGTKFTVTLPIRLQDLKESGRYINPYAELFAYGSPDGDACVAEDFRGKRVLLVEDNELNREISADILEEEGLEVESAGDGTVAVDMVRAKGPGYYDFILMDIQMPKMNGYEATRAIREMYPDRHIPIIALSANAFAEDREASRAAGMDDHVAKPISIKALFGALAKFM